MGGQGLDFSEKLTQGAMMFDWIRRLFGEGKIRVKFTDESGKEFVGRVPYIGDISTLDQHELRTEVSNQWVAKTGCRIIDFKIIW